MIDVNKVASYLGLPNRPRGSGVYAMVVLPPGDHGDVKLLDSRAQLLTFEPIVIDSQGITCGQMQGFIKRHPKAIVVPGNFGEDDVFEHYIDRLTTA